MSIETWPPHDTSVAVVRRYSGRSETAIIEEYQRDAADMLGRGWAIAGQYHVDGQWGFGWIALAVITIPIIVGILLCMRLLLTHAPGALVVTYVASGSR